MSIVLWIFHTILFEYKFRKKGLGIRLQKKSVFLY